MRHSGGVSDRTRVAVLAGGWSPEREVSLKSGAAVAKAIQQKYEVMILDPVKDLTRFSAQLLSARPDVIFNALHGTGGEDGIIAGALEMAGIPYTHSGVTASAVAMDKNLTKIIAGANGIAIAADKILTRGELSKGHPLQPPYVVKPLANGSSVGVTIVQNDIAVAAGDANERVLVERYIPGIELTVGVLGDEVLGITQLDPKNHFYDYQAKYTSGITDHIVNPELPADIVETLKTNALKIHRLLGCRDVSRSDFRYNETDGAVFLEVNTHPGMTDLSLLPEQAAARGIDFTQLVVTLLEMALSRAPLTS
jgi:D-alanine-D-alanine ligase